MIIKKYKQVLEEATKVSRIYSYYGNLNIPLGDLLIVSRFINFNSHYILATLDKGDFSTILFDRIGVVSIERKVKSKDGKPSRGVIDHIVLLKFNRGKYL